MSEKTHCDLKKCNRVIDPAEPRLEVTPKVARTASGLSQHGPALHLCGNCVRTAPAEGLRSALLAALSEVEDTPVKVVAKHGSRKG